MKIIILLLTCSNLLFAQNTIKIFVVDAGSNELLPYVTVGYVNSKMNYLADSNGKFSIVDIPSGRYNFVISDILYNPETLKVKLPQDSGTTFRVKLQRNKKYIAGRFLRVSDSDTKEPLGGCVVKQIDFENDTLIFSADKYGICDLSKLEGDTLNAKVFYVGYSVDSIKYIFTSKNEIKTINLKYGIDLDKPGNVIVEPWPIVLRKKVDNSFYLNKFVLKVTNLKNEAVVNEPIVLEPIKKVFYTDSTGVVLIKNILNGIYKVKTNFNPWEAEYLVFYIENGFIWHMGENTYYKIYNIDYNNIWYKSNKKLYNIRYRQKEF